MSTETYNHPIDIWIKELDQYTYTQLCAKPSLNSWSAGQLYLHLILDTNYFIEQIKICLTTNDNEMEEASTEGKTMLLNNAFPDILIEGAPGNAFIPQPDNKDELMTALLKLKDDIINVGELIPASKYHGKTRHPGLEYFSAAEWFRFADMHFRHHLRQKKRIDEYLKLAEI